MAGLDAKYFAAFNISETILDKDTGSLLAGGLVYFYRDQARTQLKTAYQLVSGQGGYNYVPLPNPVVLSSIGTFQDNSGNDIVPYLYPYDADGNIDLYYITIYSSLDGINPAVFQFDREAVPSSAVIQQSSEGSEAKNYIADGQFLIHSNVIPLESDVVVGQIHGPVTILSQGGWTFERSTGSGSQDAVVFNKIASAVVIPTGNPKYTCNVICYVPDGSTSFKGLRFKFDDVNKFAGDQIYTLYFSAKSASNGTLLNANLIKNFGTGGTPSLATSTPIATSLSLSTSFQSFNLSFSFGDNIGKTLGTNGDDYLQIDLAFPAAAAFNVEITDCALVMGASKLTSFPVMTNAEMIYSSIAGHMTLPNYDGSNLGLPLLLGHSGIIYDKTHISKIYTLSIPYDSDFHWNMLPCRGFTHDASGYFNGIPLSRLRDKLIVPGDANGFPRYGTGAEFLTSAYYDSHSFILVTNQPGIVSRASDGSISTGFTFLNENVDPIYTSTRIMVDSVPSAGSYFKFYNFRSQQFILWYSVDGVGTKPAEAAFKYIKCSILSTEAPSGAMDRTIKSLNAAYFATPYYNGKFLRAVSYDGSLDPDRDARTISSISGLYGVIGNNVGSNQACQIQSHTHTVSQLLHMSGDSGSPFSQARALQGGDNSSPFDSNITMSISLGSTGGSQTNPINQYVDYAIGF